MDKKSIPRRKSKTVDYVEGRRRSTREDGTAGWTGIDERGVRKRLGEKAAEEKAGGRGTTWKKRASGASETRQADRAVACLLPSVGPVQFSLRPVPSRGVDVPSKNCGTGHGSGLLDTVRLAAR